MNELVRPDFVVVRAVRGSAHSFQVYLQPDCVVFVRLGLGPGLEYAVGATGGLLGGLVAWWASSARQKRQKLREQENRSKALDQMLAEHKLNEAIPLSDFSEVRLDPGGWTRKKGSVLWRFRLPGRRRSELCQFRDLEDIHAGVQALPRAFPGIRIGVAFDPRSGKYLTRKE
jgi:hypothetical protein